MIGMFCALFFGFTGFVITLWLIVLAIAAPMRRRAARDRRSALGADRVRRDGGGFVPPVRALGLAPGAHGCLAWPTRSWTDVVRACPGALSRFA